MMNMKSPLLVLLVSVVMADACRADNPIVQTLYTADPAPMVYNDTVYLYTGHDEDQSKYYTMNDWRCYSSKDMVNWTDHGSLLSVKSFSWARSDAWAGQVIERNGKFYYYVPMNRKGDGMSLGVAVSDSPTGPYKDPLDKPLVAVGSGNIDPTVFIDNDGQAYLYWGNPNLKYVKLNQDMISYDTSVGVAKVPMTPESFGEPKESSKMRTLYTEGPWFFKRDGMYYLAYAASGIPENIAYATSSGPTGPWTYRGIIMPTEGRSFTNQTGVIDFKGHSYFFYHNGALAGGNGFNRSVCVEEFKYNADGTFPTIKMSKSGPLAIGHLNPYQQTEAATICWEQGVKTKPRGGDMPGVYVTANDNGGYIKVVSVDFGDKGATKFDASVAAAADGSTIELRLDSLSAEVIGTLKVAPTGTLDNWQTQSTSVTGLKGIHDVYLKFTGGSGPLMNFDWWKFQ